MRPFLIPSLAACLLLGLLAPHRAAAQQEAVHPIAALSEQDQSDRKQTPLLSQQVLQDHDAARRVQALTLLRNGELRTSADFHDAALIFQHGDSSDDARLALALAVISSRLDPASTKAAWLGAAAWDRLMMRYHRPQWYGTQYVPSEDGKLWMLYDFDPTPVADAERLAAGVDKAAAIERSFPRAQRPAH